MRSYPPHNSDGEDSADPEAGSPSASTDVKASLIQPRITTQPAGSASIQGRDPPTPLDSSFSDSGWDPVKWQAFCDVCAGLLAVFVAETSRGMFTPSLPAYIQAITKYDAQKTQELAAQATMAYSTGRMTFSPLIGLWHAYAPPFRTIQVPYLLCMVACLVLIGASHFGWPWILLARLLMGISSSSLTVGRAQIGEHSYDPARHMAWSALSQFFGSGVMGGLMGVYRPSNQATIFGTFILDQATASAILLFFLCIGAIIMTTWLMGREAALDGLGCTGGRTHSHSGKPGSALQPWLGIPHPEVLWVGTFVFLFQNFVTRGQLSLIESIGAVIFQKFLKGSGTEQQQQISMIFLIAGVSGFVVYFAVIKAIRYVRDVYLLYLGLFLIWVAFTLLVIDFSQLTLARYMVGFVLLWTITAPLVQTTVLTCLARVLKGRRQGVAMGFFATCGSFGRVAFPSPIAFGATVPGVFFGAGLMSWVAISAVAFHEYLVRRARRADLKIAERAPLISR